MILSGLTPRIVLIAEQQKPRRIAEADSCITSKAMKISCAKKKAGESGCARSCLNTIRGSACARDDGVSKGVAALYESLSG